MIGLFRMTLKDFAIADADVETIIADLNAHRPQIVRHRMKADRPAGFHAYRPSEIVWNGTLSKIVQQCRDHGRALGKTPGLVNTKPPRARSDDVS